MIYRPSICSGESLLLIPVDIVNSAQLTFVSFSPASVRELDCIRLFGSLSSQCFSTVADYYPQKSTESFVDRMKPLYDKYCSDGKILFAIGETGNGWEGPIEDRLGWLEQCTSAETAKAMPHLIGVVSL
jgi:hypothetical protein